MSVESIVTAAATIVEVLIRLLPRSEQPDARRDIAARIDREVALLRRSAQAALDKRKRKP